MKTFEDLNFKEHPIAKSGIDRFENAKQAIEYFDNGYGVSVVFGSCFYSNGLDTYEVAILHEGNITYDTGITDDVIGYIKSDKVSDIMRKVQLLKQQLKPNKMKNEILNDGIEKTISDKQRNFNNMIFITFVMSVTALITSIMLAVQTKKTEALEFQVSQRDSIIAAQNAHLNELTFDNINLVNNK